MLSDLKSALFHSGTLASWAVLSLLLTVMGPFATYEAPFQQRVTTWPLIVGAVMATGIAIRLTIRRRLPALTFWQRTALCAGTLSVVTAVPAYKLTLGMTVLDRVPGPVEGALEAGLVILAFALGLNTLRYALGLNEIIGAKAAWAPAIMARLPEARRGALIRLSSSDHYVRVVTENGHEDVLIRLADAIAECRGVAGVRVHRSHWVAEDGVSGHRRESGRLFLVTRDGAEIPVSRSCRPEVEARGLLRDA